jgi:signal transduction histidine kinase
MIAKTTDELLTVVDPGGKTAANATQRGRGRPNLALAASFALVIVSFCAATAYSQSWAARSHRPALDITANAAPSILELSSARAELRHLEQLIANQLRVAERHQAVDLDAVNASRSRFEDHVRSYLALPFFPGERALWHEVDRTLDAFDHATDEVVSALGENRPAAAAHSMKDSLEPAYDAVADALMKSIRFNAERAAELAAYVESTRRRTLVLAVGLDVLSAAAALVTAFLVTRVLRRHDAVLSQRNLLLANQAAELEAFSGRVAHDLLNPLSAALLGVERAAPLVDDARAKQALDRTSSALGRARRLIEDLLAFARAGGVPEVDAACEVAGVVAAVARDLDDDARRVGAQIRVDLPEGLVARCAPGTLTSVAGNLIKNAIKYSGRPGNVIRVEARARGETVRIEVSDRGTGIAEDKLEVIFLPYIRADKTGMAGLGLGLATVKRLVEAHGGRVGVRSRLEEGSTFWFELPLVRG